MSRFAQANWAAGDVNEASSEGYKEEHFRRHSKMPSSKRRRTNDRPSCYEESGHRQNHGSENGHGGDFSFVLDTHGEELKEDVYYSPEGGVSKDDNADADASGLLLPGNVRVLEAEANAARDGPSNASDISEGDDDDMGHFDVLDDDRNAVSGPCEIFACAKRLPSAVTTGFSLL